MSAQGNTVDPDAPYLHEDMYLNSEQYMDDNGRIQMNSLDDVEPQSTSTGSTTVEANMHQLQTSFLMNQSPPLPQQEDEPFIDNEKAPLPTMDEDGLLRAMSDHNQRMAMGGGSQQKEMAEKLYNQVFSNEEGYLNQSDVFRKSLFQNDNDVNRDPNDSGGGSTSTTTDYGETTTTSQEEIDPVAWRRGADYRKRQEEAMKNIESEMAQLEQSVLSREEAIAFAKAYEETPPDPFNQEQHVRTVICSQCSAIMTPSEITAEQAKGKDYIHMICRECHLSTMEKRNSSPFLVGRSGALNSRASGGPRTEFYSSDVSTLDDGVKKEPSRVISPLTQSIASERKIPIRASDPMAWRNQFTKAMENRVLPKDASANRYNTTQVKVSRHEETINRETIDAGAKNDTALHFSPSESVLSAVQDLDSRNKRYANRIFDLEHFKKDLKSDVWDAQYASALHRQSSIRKMEEVTKDSESALNDAPTSNKDNSEQISKRKVDITSMKRRYEKRIESLLNEVNDLQSQLNASRKEVPKAAAEKPHVSHEPKKSRRQALRDIVEQGELDDIPF